MNSKILVVDDESHISSALQERLILEGHKVWVASHGRQGLQLYQEHLVDLVITDVLMPEMDGLELLRMLRGLSADLPIIVMSGGAQRGLDFLIEAKEFGATRTIAKPFKLDEFVEVVHAVLSALQHGKA